MVIQIMFIIRTNEFHDLYMFQLHNPKTQRTVYTSRVRDSCGTPSNVRLSSS